MTRWSRPVALVALRGTLGVAYPAQQGRPLRAALSMGSVVRARGGWSVEGVVFSTGDGHEGVSRDPNEGVV